MTSTNTTMEDIFDDVEHIRNGQYLVPMNVWHVEFEDGFEIYLTWFKDFEEPDFVKFFGDDFKSAVQVLESKVVPTQLYSAWEPA